MAKMETYIGIAIPGVGEPDIETPGVEDLYVDLYLYLYLDIGIPGVKIEIPPEEIPPEATGPSKTTGVTEYEEVTYPQGTDK